MYVLFNKHLNIYFKYQGNIWWTKDISEANTLLEAIKECVNHAVPEMLDGIVIIKVDDLPEEA